MKRVFVSLVAALAAWLGLVQPVQAAVATTTWGFATCTYDGHHEVSVLTTETSERGPPVASSRLTTYDAVDRGSRGASATAQQATAPPRATTTCDGARALVQVARTMPTTREPAQVAGSQLVVFDRAGVAANTLAKACSFTGATAVLMADGTKKPIEEIEIGDEVIATDPETGEQVAKKVEHVFVHEDTVTDLVIDGQVISTTEDHPFWSATDQRFERADQLAEGEKVLGADGRVLTVSGLELGTTRTTTAYNLSVEGIHTYHVGGAEILVHNNCINWAANSVKTFGHTFNTHGAGPKNLRSLTDRARGTGEAQGQWLDNAAAADFLSNAHVSGAGPYSVRLPEGLGQVIMPDGSIVQARAATIVPNPNGVIRTAFPILGGP